MRGLTALLFLLPAMALAQPLSPSFSNVTIQPGGTVSLAQGTATTPSLIIPPGSALTTCATAPTGSTWTTNLGFFACFNGGVVGPLATGANIVSAPANSVTYYSLSAQLSGITGTNGVLVTDGSGVPSISNTLPTGLIIASPVFNPPTYTTSTLPVVTNSNQGQLAWVSNCLNGTQGSGSGTGCYYNVNAVGAWTPDPSVPTLGITVGGQLTYLGQSTINMGTGSQLATATGLFTTGHCLNVGSNGAVADAGGACTTGGGGGTVTASPQNEIAYYSSAGTTATVSGLALAANAVLVTNGSSVPSEATTLPSSLTIPAPTISNAVLTGAATYVGLTGTGRLVTAASTTSQSGINLPAGVAPTSPVNGDMWTTSAALFTYINGATQEMLSNVSTTSPLGGGGVGPSLTLTCTTCATTTNGGLLTATAPMTISAAGLVALGLQPDERVWFAGASTVVVADTIPIIEKWPWTNPGTVNSVVYHTNGTSTPSFTIALQINGVNVTSCNALTVSSSSDTTATCTAANAITNGQSLTLVESGISGSPSDAVVQINISKPAS